MRRAESIRSLEFVGGVLGTAFAVALGFGLIVPALPLFATMLGADFGATSALVSAFAAVRLVSSGPAGWLSDRIGARGIVALGLVVVAVSSAAIAVSTTYVHLLLTRGAGGVGSAMFIVGISQHIVRTIPSAERARANGTLQGAFLLGGASGPAVGGVVVDAVGIRAPFVIYAVTLLAATVLTLRYLSEERVVDDAAVEVAPVAAVRARGRLRPLLTDRTFVASLLLYAAVSWGAQGTRFVAVPLLGSEVLGGSTTAVGLALGASSVAHGALLWPVSQLADRRGRLLPARVGAIVYVVSMLGLATVAGPVGLVAWMVVQGAANGITSPIPAAVVGDLSPPDAAGRAMGLTNVARDAGSVLGPLATGFLAEAFGFDAAFVAAAALLAVAFVATLAMRETLEPAAGR